jgi:hypothetical protein
LILSRSVDVWVHAPNEREAALLGALRDATAHSGYAISDTAKFHAIERTIEEYPVEPTTFYLRRAIAIRYWLGLRGREPDLPRALTLLNNLEDAFGGLRRQEIQLQMLAVYRDLNARGALDATLRSDAESLIAAMQAADPSLWTNQRFYSIACDIRLAEFGDGSYYAAHWWEIKMLTDGPHPPSWDELTQVAAAAPPRREFVGPTAMRPTIHHRQHIRR